MGILLVAFRPSTTLCKSCLDGFMDCQEQVQHLETNKKPFCLNCEQNGQGPDLLWRHCLIPILDPHFWRIQERSLLLLIMCKGMLMFIQADWKIFCNIQQMHGFSLLMMSKFSLTTSRLVFRLPDIPVLFLIPLLSVLSRKLILSFAVLVYNGWTCWG